eukprot:GFYU01000990.1.p1 GENE.GFYU01000990.1~~GFYU01000990.1.p1  ORF type:complete len:301 (+),score=61.05 GFYU01000990.1:45-947(+)
MSSVVVTGASGLLGRAVIKVLKASNVNVTGLAFSRTGNGLVKCDLTNADEVEKVLSELKPTCIIHCAAERRPDVVSKEADKTKAINVGATETLARLAEKLSSFLVYVSTDYVFDGSSPPYAPTDAPNPLNEYGVSKLDGEKTVMATSPNASVLRLPVLYGEVESLDESAVLVVAKQVLAGKPAAVDNWGVRYPTHVEDVAVAILRLIQTHGSDSSKVTGKIFHFSNSEKLSKYEQAQIMGQVLQVPVDHLSADNNPPPGAPRPKDTHLDATTLREAVAANGELQHTPFLQALQGLLPRWK